MENVILVIHLILALGIIGLVLIQRSEGGGLGIGGGGGGLGGLATPQGTASVLTRLTAFFAVCFFATSLTLAILAGTHNNQDGILDTYKTEAAVTIEERAATEEILNNNETGEALEASTEESEESSGETEPEASNDPEESDTIKPAPKPSVPIGE